MYWLVPCIKLWVSSSPWKAEGCLTQCWSFSKCNDWVKEARGVPQGSVFGHLLFVVNLKKNLKTTIQGMQRPCMHPSKLWPMIPCKGLSGESHCSHCCGLLNRHPDWMENTHYSWAAAQEEQNRNRLNFNLFVWLNFFNQNLSFYPRMTFSVIPLNAFFSKAEERRAHRGRQKP